MIRARPPVEWVPAPDDGGEVVGGAGVPDFGERLTQAHPVKPEDLRRGADGMLVFWIDNQHGYYWAADPDSVKHQVFDRTNTSAEWKPTGESVERFLLHRTVHEALVGTGNKFSAVVPTEVLGSGVLDSCASFPFTPAVHDAPSTPVAVQRRRPGEGGPATGWLCPARPGELMLTSPSPPLLASTSGGIVRSSNRTFSKGRVALYGPPWPRPSEGGHSGKTSAGGVILGLLVAL